MSKSADSEPLPSEGAGGGGAGPSHDLDQELTALAERGAAVLVVSGDGGRVLWCTPAGAALFGARSPEELESKALDPRLVPVDRLAELARREAPTAGARLERVRIHAGRRSEAVTLACRRAVLRSGEAVLVAIGFGVRAVPPRRGAERPAPRLELARPEEAAPEVAQQAAPVTIESVRERNAGRSTFRFVWQSNAEGVLTSVSGELTRLLGPGSAPLPGETWASLLSRGVADETGALAAALAAERTFTGADIAWPVDGAGFRVPVSLSGVPALDAERRFTGFRGFGLCRLDRELPPAVSVEEPAGPPAHEPELEATPEFVAAEAEAAGEAEDGAGEATGPAPEEFRPAGEATPASAPEVQGSASEAMPAQEAEQATAGLAAASVAASSPEPAPSPDAAAPVAAEPLPLPAPPVPRTIVELGEIRVNGRPQTPPANVVHLHGPASVQAPALSRSERHAFREIARALGARIEGQDEDAPSGQDESPAPAMDSLAAAQELAETAGSADPDAGETPLPVEPSELARHAETLFDRLPIGILVSRGAVPIVMNRTLLDLLGYESVDAFFDDGGLQRLFRGRPPEAVSGEAPATDGTTVSLEARDGTALYVDARLQTISWDGLPATLMSFRRVADPDLAPRLKAAEIELRQRETDARELRAMLDTATDGVVTIDENGRILSINRSGEALFGYDQREVAGETFISLLAPDSHATALDYLEGLKSNGVASILNDGREVVGRVRQGGRIPLFMTLGAISEAPERKFCAVLRDLTPWKKAESELIEARRVAEEASAQKSDFLAKISHEIRTPLSAIIGFAEVMIEERFGPVGNERYLEYLRDMHASGGHVISLVNDLLDLSKIEAGRFDLTFVSVDVNEIVSRSVAIMQPQAGSGRVVVRTALHPRLPRVVADERSLRQIVLNLLSNAIKFTDPGGQVIVSTAFTDAGEVVVRIRDTGIGMSEKDIETALEPFRQVATTRRSGGTGLGLPLTKALVEANRASLSIRSAREAGTLVEVTFPTTRVLAE